MANYREKRNLIIADGYTVRTLGMVGLEYQAEGETVNVDSEMLASPKSIALWASSVPRDSRDRALILQRVTDALAGVGFTVYYSEYTAPIPGLLVSQLQQLLKSLNINPALYSIGEERLHAYSLVETGPEWVITYSDDPQPGGLAEIFMSESSACNYFLGHIAEATQLPEMKRFTDTISERVTYPTNR